MKGYSVLALVVGCLLGFLLAGTRAERKSYKGYKVFEIVPENEETVRTLRHILDQDENLDVWLEPSQPGRPVHVMVSPQQMTSFLTKLKDASIRYTTHRENVQDTLDVMWKQLDEKEAARSAAAGGGGMVFDIDDYNSLVDIQSWLYSQETGAAASSCRSDLNCRVAIIGQTFEGRPIHSFRITKPDQPDRKVVFIDATIHAREWIATATALKLIDALSRGSTPEAARLADAFDFYIIPIINPDGYLYSFTNDRYWRKNMKPVGACYGTDLNRNFDNKWGTDGVSHSPCAITFCGAGPASEVETQSIQQELRGIAHRVHALLTLHSYGRMWMFSWGNTVNHDRVTCERADDHYEMMRVADLAANAVENTHGTVWLRGNSCEVIYTTSGSSQDYAKGGAGIKYSYTLELRGSDFVIDNSNIQPSFEEVWNGLVTMLNAIPTS